MFPAQRCSAACWVISSVGGTWLRGGNCGGALAGAGAAQVWTQPQSREHSPVELLIRDEKGPSDQRIQDYDPAMIFGPGDKVRILYFDDGVRVDKTF